MADDVWLQLARDMAGASAAIDASNPWRKGSVAIGNLSQQAYPAIASDPKEALIGIALSQFLSGALGGVADTYTQNRIPEYQSVMEAATAGRELPTTEYLDSDSALFREAKQKGQLFQIMNQADRMKAEQEARLKKQDRLESKLMEYGLAISEDGKLVDLGLSGMEAKTEADKKLAVLEAEDAFYNKGFKSLSDSSSKMTDLNPNSPQYKTTKDAEDALDKLRSEFQGRDVFKEFEKVDKGYRALVKAKDDPSAVSDLDFVYGAIQMIEPGMAVKEGEQEAVRSTSSIPQQLQGAMISAMEGKARLQPDTRKAILDLAARRYEGHADKFNTALSFYKDQAERRGLPDPGAVSYLTAANDPKAILKQLGAAVEPAQAGTVEAQLTSIRDALRAGNLSDSQKLDLIKQANQLATKATGPSQATKADIAKGWGG